LKPEELENETCSQHFFPRLVKLHKSFEATVNNESWLTLAKKRPEGDLKLEMDFEYMNFLNQKK